MSLQSQQELRSTARSSEWRSFDPIYSVEGLYSEEHEIDWFHYSRTLRPIQLAFGEGVQQSEILYGTAIDWAPRVDFTDLNAWVYSAARRLASEVSSTASRHRLGHLEEVVSHLGRRLDAVERFLGWTGRMPSGSPVTVEQAADALARTLAGLQLGEYTVRWETVTTEWDAVEFLARIELSVSSRGGFRDCERRIRKAVQDSLPNFIASRTIVQVRRSNSTNEAD